MATALVVATGTAGLFVVQKPAEAQVSYGVTKVHSRQLTQGFGQSSPNVGVLNGVNSIVVGNADGQLHAFRPDLSYTPGWPQNLGNGIDGSPAIADIDGNGSNEVFIGTGVAASRGGNMFALNENGSTRWRFAPSDPDFPSLSMQSSPAIGEVNFDGVADVSGFSLGLLGWSFNANTGAVNGGWPFYQDDTVFSSPAIADVDGDGRPDYIVGADSSPGGPVDHQGGMVRAIRGDGSLIWEYRTNEIVASSPVVADLDGNGSPEIVVGTGEYWIRGANGGTGTDSNKLRVLNSRGQLIWDRDLGAHVVAAPALADVNGDGALDIVVGTWNDFDAGSPDSGKLWAFDRNGNALPGFGGIKVPGGVILAQVSTADFNNDGKQDIVVPTGAGLYVYNGSNGSQMFTLGLGENQAYQSTPWIGDIDGNGRLDIIASSVQGLISRWEMNTGTARLGANGYHEFRKDARHTGSFTNPPLAQDFCSSADGQGYLLSASDGGMFAFCQQFYGSTGNIKLNQPIVGSASKADKSGYWQVASDGGVFAFGSAGFAGSTGNIALNQPIVAMAATPSGNGYWLVARDGGVFAFGDARFAGSTGDLVLNQPIVGAASTKSGNGYWLVAADGGIFAFGDATFYGSTGNISLNQPIVAMARTNDGNGYWLTAADGGIFAFGDAQFLGSTGNIKLNQPVVGIVRSESGNGYRLVARDGGIFAFGDAKFLGSTASIRLNGPIVAAN